MNAKRNERGFTLLELLMVVIIIAILASIALPQYLRATERSRASEALQVLGAIRGSQQRFRASAANGLYTNVAANLDMTFTAMTNWNAPVFSAPAITGSVTVTRNGAGAFAGQILGIQYGTGTVCGNFAPMLPLAGCVAD